MARRPRKCGEEIYHHIYAWGNNRQVIFITDEHYERYISFLEKYSSDNRIRVIAYALMQTHVHLYVYDLLGKLSQFMNSLHGEYAQYFNHVTGRVGHVFGERFNNKIVQANEYGLWLSRYIHRQAVEAGLVTDPVYYRWTSYHTYLGVKTSGFVQPDVILEQFGNVKERVGKYEAFVKGHKKGPIDWKLESTEVIGNETFRRGILQRLRPEPKKYITDEQICELIIERFKVDPGSLSALRGLKKKRLRRRIMAYLVGELGLKPARLAQLFKISHMTVRRALVAKS
ncbi:MAG: transposase [candidate division WOR-3 bacterium]|nr:MAG: transposase [candidate division WOR-3 bacterium]